MHTQTTKVLPKDRTTGYEFFLKWPFCIPIRCLNALIQLAKVYRFKSLHRYICIYAVGMHENSRGR